MSDPLWVNSGKAPTAVGTATIAASTDLFTIATHGLADGDTVSVDTLTGGATAVLVENAVYFVRDALTNTFALSLTLHGAPVLFATDGGADVYRWAPGYNAQELRQAAAAWLYPGVASEFGARAGVRPHPTAPLSVAGTTWTVHNLTAVVAGAGSGPYVVAHPEETDNLDPADGSNPRIDALDLQIQDDDEDASGQRRGRVVYVAGTPASSPSAPSVTANALRLGTVLVPAGGSPTPSVQSLAVMTVASGGLLPVRDATELPTTRPDGSAAVQLDSGAVLVRLGGEWGIVGMVNRPMLRLILDANTNHTTGSEKVLGVMSADVTHGTWAAPIHSSVRTIPLDGVYRVSATVRVSGGAGTGKRQVAARKNVTTSDPTTGTLIGTALIDGTAHADGNSPQVSLLHQFAAGDNVTCSFVHSDSSTVVVRGGAVNTFIELEWLRGL